MLLTQHLGEEAEGIPPLLLAGPQHTGQDLLGPGSGPGAIATPHLASHDGGPDRMLGPPVRGLDVVAGEEGEQVVSLAREMLGEATVGWMRDPAGKGAIDLCFQPPARDGETVRRDLAVGATLATRQRG